MKLGALAGTLAVHEAGSAGVNQHAHTLPQPHGRVDARKPSPRACAVPRAVHRRLCLRGGSSSDAGGKEGSGNRISLHDVASALQETRAQLDPPEAQGAGATASAHALHPRGSHGTGPPPRGTAGQIGLPSSALAPPSASTRLPLRWARASVRGSYTWSRPPASPFLVRIPCAETCACGTPTCTRS